MNGCWVSNGSDRAPASESTVASHPVKSNGWPTAWLSKLTVFGRDGLKHLKLGYLQFQWILISFPLINGYLGGIRPFSHPIILHVASTAVPRRTGPMDHRQAGGKSFGASRRVEIAALGSQLSDWSVDPDMAIVKWDIFHKRSLSSY